MAKLIGFPAGMIVGPQLIWWSFFLLVRLLGLDSPETRGAFAVFGGVFLLISTVVAIVCLFDWIPEFREKREAERAALLATIDIGRPS